MSNWRLGGEQPREMALQTQFMLGLVFTMMVAFQVIDGETSDVTLEGEEKNSDSDESLATYDSFVPKRRPLVVPAMMNVRIPKKTKKRTKTNFASRFQALGAPLVVLGLLLLVLGTR